MLTDGLWTDKFDFMIILFRVICQIIRDFLYFRLENNVFNNNNNNNYNIMSKIFEGLQNIITNKLFKSHY